jgi:hypothetical protein
MPDIAQDVLDRLQPLLESGTLDELLELARDKKWFKTAIADIQSRVADGASYDELKGKLEGIARRLDEMSAPPPAPKEEKHVERIEPDQPEPAARSEGPEPEPEAGDDDNPFPW